MKTPPPPRWLLTLVRFAAGPLADHVEGDLREWTLKWSRESGRLVGWLRGVAAGLALLPRLGWSNLRENGLSLPGSSLDMRLALRLLWRQPGLSATSILALAVTMGLAITGYTVASDALYGTLDVADADRLFVTRMVDTRSQGQAYPSIPEAARMRTAESVEDVGLFTLLSLNLGLDEGLPVQVSASRVDGQIMSISGVRPELGRLISEADIRLDRDVIVIASTLWKARFGGDPGVIGRLIMVDGRPHEVIGVTPSGFHFPVNQDAWVPLRISPSSALNSGFPGLRLMGRVIPGRTLEDVDTEFTQLMAAGPQIADRSVVPESVPFTRGFMSRGSDAVFVALVMALVALVLVAAANIANLILARTEARVGELAVRTALGASRARIVGQLFIEVFALTALAAILALVGANFALGWMRALITELPYWITMEIGLPIVAFSFVLALLAASVAGAYPAFRATGSGISDGMRRIRTPGFGKLSGAVIVAELALTVGLLAGSLAMGRGLLGYQARDYGLPEDQVLTAQIFIPVALTDDEDESAAALANEVERLRITINEAMAALPTVRAIGFSGNLPGTGGSPTRTLQIAGSDEVFEAHAFSADRGFYEAIDLETIAGRGLEDASVGSAGTPEVLVNEPFVREALGGRNPIGQQVRWVYGGTAGEWQEIVGVVPDIGLEPGDEGRAAAIHTPLAASNFLTVSIRTAGDPTSVAPALRNAVNAFSPRARLNRVQLLSHAGWEARALLQGLGAGLLLLGLMALLLSSAGLYAILSFAVSRRTREIGIRVAFGASSASVLGSILPRTLGQVALGTVIGSAIGLAGLRFTSVLPVSVPDSPVLHIVAPAAILVAGALLATLRPTLRALAIRPADALRQE